MRARITDAFRRVCLGTSAQLDALGHWFSGASHPGRFGRALVILRRLGVLAAAFLFWGQLLARAPYFLYAVPVVWAVSAWQMSDSSATPPPRGVTPSRIVDAGHARKNARGAQDPNGVMCIYHPPSATDREGVNEP
ncbi:hypothetical protein [Streptomyces sp. NPDC058247]|uniref:hypothetical protein n=1 Tax=Streptomyces sp. NPDC058247 TaxID=3346401 RepID=UPI0036E44BB3